MSNDHPNRIRILPWHTIKKIVGYTDYYSRFALRLVSKEFMYQVDRLNCRFESISFNMQEDEVYVRFTSNSDNTLRFIYKKRDVLRKRKSPGEVTFGCPCPVEMAVCRLATVFRNPKTTVRFLHVYYSDYAKSTDIVVKRKHLFDRNAFLQTFRREMSWVPHRMHIGQLRVQIGMNEPEGLCLLEFADRATLRRLQLIVYPFKIPVDEWKGMLLWNEFTKVAMEESAGRTIFEMHYDVSTVTQMAICLDAFGSPIDGFPVDRICYNLWYHKFIHVHCHQHTVYFRSYTSFQIFLFSIGLVDPNVIVDFNV